jgi:hypothetical protein
MGKNPDAVEQFPDPAWNDASTEAAGLLALTFHVCPWIGGGKMPFSNLQG